MMRSMYSGVAGLKTHQTKMDVIGNNIANVNTVAYKSSSITFSELMYQTTQKSSGPNELTGTGGTNARQIGLGVQSGAINTSISSQGATQTTGNPFDLCITGDSFFVVSDGSTNFFTRAGAFNVDSIGNLVMTSNGYNVMGWNADDATQTITKNSVQPLRVMAKEKLTYPPEATSKSYISGILDKNDPDVATEAGKKVNLIFYDNLGYSYTAKCSIHQTTNDGEYYVQLDDILDANSTSIVEKYNGLELKDLVKVNTGEGYTADISLAYNYVTGVEYSNGSLEYPNATGGGTTTVALGTTLTPDPATDPTRYTYENATGTPNAAITAMLVGAYGLTEADAEKVVAFEIDQTTGTLTVTKKDIVGAKLLYNTDNGYFSSIDGVKNITLDFEDSVTDADGNVISLNQFSDITMDWSATNMYNNSGTSTIGATSGDTDGIGSGRKLGNMTGITIQTNGMIYASYDNGMTRLLGQIAVAEFTNAAGLEKAGDNLYQASLNSGEFDGVGVDITGSGGYMTTGVLEMSNVDLSAEFTEMITTQRGFQANSRIITVSDTMLEELVNLKR